YLSPYLRGKVAGAVFAGVKPGDDKRNEGKTIFKAARRRLYTLVEERKLLQHIRKFLKDSYEDVIRACNLGCKVFTIKKILVNQTTYIVLSLSRVDPRGVGIIRLE
ncbi:hypothetical protein DL98DRAFT_518447, partial [Cadophora sp. DSE1049]